MTNYPFSATALAVLTALTLTACGGSSGFDGPISSTTIWNSNKQTSNSNANTAKTEAKPNQDSDQFTTASPRPDDFVIDSKILPMALHSAVTRASLHNELEKAYGEKFETTFEYTTAFTNNKTQERTKTYINQQSIPTHILGNGNQDYTMNETLETNIDGVKYTGERKSRVKLYQQDNSIVLGMQTLSGKMTASNSTGHKDIKPGELRINHLKGLPFKRPSEDAIKTAQEDLKTKSEAIVAASNALSQAQKANGKEADANAIQKAQADLQKAQSERTVAQQLLEKYTKQDRIFTENGGMKFSYTGQAFNKDSTGDLEYHINFNTYAGHGKITGLSGGTIDLNEGKIQSVSHTNPEEGIVIFKSDDVANQTSLLGIQGDAHFGGGRKDGKYTLGIFGDYAEEVAGFVTEDNVNTVGFGGKRPQ